METIFFAAVHVQQIIVAKKLNVVVILVTMTIRSLYNSLRQLKFFIATLPITETFSAVFPIKTLRLSEKQKDIMLKANFSWNSQNAEKKNM